MKKIQIALVFVLIALLMGACSSTPATPAPTATPEVHPGQALVTSRCATCHSLGVIENAKYDEGGWKVTVERMVKSGATLNAEQQVHVIDYLAKTYPKQ